MKESIIKNTKSILTPKRIVFLLIVGLFAVFTLQNAQVVEVKFLFWSTEASRSIVLLLTFALGLICGWLFIWVFKKRTTKKTKNEQ